MSLLDHVQLKNSLLLTRKENEVAKLTAYGLSSKVVGRVLGISPRTVERHRGKIIAKNKAKNITHAIFLLYCD